MSTNNAKPQSIHPPLNLRELTAVLIKHYGIHEGRYDLLMEFQIGTGMFGPTPEATCPSAMIGFSSIGLMPSLPNSPVAVDAAEVNPQKKKTKKMKDET